MFVRASKLNNGLDISFRITWSYRELSKVKKNMVRRLNFMEANKILNFYLVMKLTDFDYLEEGRVYMFRVSLQRIDGEVEARASAKL